MSETVRVLPPYFPASCAPCREATARFFHCFTTKGSKLASTDAAAARRGLEECQSELRAYSECMEAKCNAKNA
jgi:hypothetical protein